MADRIEKIRSKLEHQCDGPLTPFVLMFRAIELSSKGIDSPDTIANALYDAMLERDWCVGDDAIEVAGS